MDKETLSNYGWIVICVLVLAVMLALATPFGTFVADSFKATYTGLFQTGDNALDVGLNAVGVSNKLPCGHGRKEAGDHSQKECGHYNCQDTDCGCVPASCGIEGHWSGDGMDHTTAATCGKHNIVCQCTTWIVPDGGTYTRGLITYNAGDTVYCIKDGDVYTQGNYKYTYYKSTYGGWKVEINTSVTDNKQTAYGSILETINYEPITYLGHLFYSCENLVEAPKIPSTVTSLYYTFTGCTSLKRYEGSADADGDFSNYVIPNGVTNMHHAFSYCKSIVKAPAIPNSVTTMLVAFSNCTSLVTAPEIPSSVTNLQGAFMECSMLTGTITIHANPEAWTKCLYKTQITSIIGNTTMAEHLMLTKTSTASNPTP